MSSIICPDHRADKDPCTFYIKGADKSGYCSLGNHFHCIEYIRRFNPRLSKSAVIDFKQCRRKYYYGSLCGLQRTEPNPNFLGGNLIDARMGAFHSDNHIDRNWEYTKYEDQADLLAMYQSDWATDILCKARAVCDAYPDIKIMKPKGKPQHTVVKQVQSKHSHHVEFDIKVIMDLFVKKTDKHEEHIWDWKYTSKPESYTFYTTRTQTMFSFLLSDAEAMTYRLIRNPALKRKTDEPDDVFYDRIYKDVLARPKWYFEDKTFYRGEYDLDAFKDELRQIASEIKGLLDKPIESWYPDETSCFNPWKCEYYDICTSGVISGELYGKREVIT